MPLGSPPRFRAFGGRVHSVGPLAGAAA